MLLKVFASIKGAFIYDINGYLGAWESGKIWLNLRWTLVPINISLLLGVFDQREGETERRRSVFQIKCLEEKPYLDFNLFMEFLSVQALQCCRSTLFTGLQRWGANSSQDVIRVNTTKGIIDIWFGTECIYFTIFLPTFLLYLFQVYTICKIPPYCLETHIYFINANVEGKNSIILPSGWNIVRCIYT